MKIKLFVAREIQYFELGIFSFNSHVYYLTCGFIASTRACNLLARAFNPPTRASRIPTSAFNLATRAFSVLTRRFQLVTRGFELVTHRFELLTCRFELATHGFELVTRNSCFTFPQSCTSEHIPIGFALSICYGKDCLDVFVEKINKFWMILQIGLDKN